MINNTRMTNSANPEAEPIIETRDMKEKRYEGIINSIEYNHMNNIECPHGHGKKTVTKYHGKPDIVMCLDPAVKKQDEYRGHSRYDYIGPGQTPDPLQDTCKKSCPYLNDMIKKGHDKMLAEKAASEQSKTTDSKDTPSSAIDTTDL
jgi:hypothetical protein